jgi:hypothetical protein
VREFFSLVDSEKKFHNNDYQYGTSGKSIKEITPSKIFDRVSYTVK